MGLKFQSWKCRSISNLCQDERAQGVINELSSETELKLAKEFIKDNAKKAIEESSQDYIDQKLMMRL